MPDSLRVSCCCLASGGAVRTFARRAPRSHHPVRQPTLLQWPPALVIVAKREKRRVGARSRPTGPNAHDRGGGTRRDARSRRARWPSGDARSRRPAPRQAGRAGGREVAAAAHRARMLPGPRRTAGESPCGRAHAVARGQRELAVARTRSLLRCLSIQQLRPSNDRLELRLAARRQAPPAEAGLVDEHQLGAVLSVFPDLHPIALRGIRARLLDDLVGPAKPDEHHTAISQPTSATFLTKPLVCFLDAAEIVSQSLMFGRRRYRIGFGQELRPCKTAEFRCSVTERANPRWWREVPQVAQHLLERSHGQVVAEA